MIISILAIATLTIPVLMIIAVITNTIIETQEHKQQMATRIANYHERMDRRDGLPVDNRWTDAEALELANL